MVAVFMPGLKSTLRAKLPDHQSHAALPDWIQEVSPIWLGWLRFIISSLDSIRPPGREFTMITRHGVALGVEPATARSACPIIGDSLPARPLGTPSAAPT